QQISQPLEVEEDRAVEVLPGDLLVERLDHRGGGGGVRRHVHVQPEAPATEGAVELLEVRGRLWRSICREVSQRLDVMEWAERQPALVDGEDRVVADQASGPPKLRRVLGGHEVSTGPICAGEGRDVLQ